jgi:thymidylate kinase
MSFIYVFKAINRFAIGELMPDVTLYLDIEPEAGLACIDERCSTRQSV